MNDLVIKSYSKNIYVKCLYIRIKQKIYYLGDHKFQKKCGDRLLKMVENGTTAIIVSHDINLVNSVCNKAVWLEHGKIKKIGSAQEVCAEYES